MIWLKRKLTDRPLLLAAVQGRFDTIWSAAGSPKEMMLVEQEHEPRVSTLWLRLGDERFVSAFGEFERADEAALPKRATILCGDQNEFEAIFDFDAPSED